MSRKRLHLTAPVVVTMGLLACGGAAEKADNPPAVDHQNPPAPEATGEATPQPHANPPGHPDTPHKNPPGPGDDSEVEEVEVNKNPPAPEE